MRCFNSQTRCWPMIKNRALLGGLGMGLVLCFVVLTADALSAQQNFSHKKKSSPVIKNLSGGNFEVGENLIFDVSWFGINVGFGSLEVKEKVRINGRDAFHVVAVAKTNDFLSKIYPIHDEVHSYIDVEKMYSLEFRKTLREGGYRADEKMVYDHERLMAHYESLKNKTKKEIEIPSGVQDFLSAFFWFRRQPIEIGKSVRTLVNSEEKNWDLEIKALKIEVKELRGGKVIPAVLVEPKSHLKGILYDRGRVWVHFSADEKRIPIWIKIQTPFGPVSGVLKTEGLPFIDTHS